MKPTNRERQILNCFAVQGQMTYYELAKYLPHLACLDEACESLTQMQHLKAVRKPGSLPVFTITYKGRNFIGRTKAKDDTGDLPEPRSRMSDEQYIPSPFVYRAGSQDFLKCQSRRGDSFTEHRLPISLAGA